MQKDLWAKRRDMEWKHIRIDGYTYSLLQRAVEEGRAASLVDAVNRGACSLLGIRYKSTAEVKMEQEAALVQELSKKAMKEE